MYAKKVLINNLGNFANGALAHISVILVPGIIAGFADFICQQFCNSLIPSSGHDSIARHIFCDLPISYGLSKVSLLRLYGITSPWNLLRAIYIGSFSSTVLRWSWKYSSTSATFKSAVKDVDWRARICNG